MNVNICLNKDLQMIFRDVKKRNDKQLKNQHVYMFFWIRKYTEKSRGLFMTCFCRQCVTIKGFIVTCFSYILSIVGSTVLDLFTNYYLERMNKLHVIKIERYMSVYMYTGWLMSVSRYLQDICAIFVTVSFDLLRKPEFPMKPLTFG